MMINCMKWLNSFFPCSSVFLSHLRIGSTRAFPRRRVCACVYRDAPTGLSRPGPQEGLHRSGIHLLGGGPSIPPDKQLRGGWRGSSVLPARTSEEDQRVKTGSQAACKPPRLCLLLQFLWQMLSANSKQFSVLCPLCSDAPSSTASCPFSSQPGSGSHLIKDNPT